MRHSILAPTHADARRLARIITDEGHHARVITTRRHAGVIIHAPLAVVANACQRASIDPERYLNA
jgi:hypothetical protein